MRSLDDVIREGGRPPLAGPLSAPSAWRRPGRRAWRGLEAEAEAALATVEHQPSQAASPGPRPFYRIVAWNIQRGLAFEGVLHHLRHHPLLRRADVLLLTEADKGMARSRRRDVARELAEALSMHAAFVPCHLQLNDDDTSAEGPYSFGLHGNAILSRYLLSRFRVHSLPNGHAAGAVPAKRLGRQRCLTARVELPAIPATFTCIHLDARSSRRHRQRQIARILAETADIAGPRVLGGDWNTSTHDCQHYAPAVLGLLGRIATAPGRTILSQYLHPERHFERELFESLEAAGFDWTLCNRVGVGTWRYEPRSDGIGEDMDEWLPGWAPRAIDWLLRDAGGPCTFKLDWFATRGVRCADPAVVEALAYQGRRVSDHDPIAVDLLPEL